MSTKFEQLLDLLVNEEMDKANELFHEIVVEKSREIYENLIAEETDDDELEESDDDELEESDDDELEESDDDLDEAADEEAEEGMDLEDSYMMDGDDEDDMGGDATDDLGSDVGMGDMGDEEEPEGQEDKAIFDIKNAIAELEAAFAELEQAQGGDMGGDDDEFSAGGDDSDDMGGDDMMGKPAFESRRLREYSEKVSDGHGADKKGAAEGGIAGANTGDAMPSGTNTRSPISSGKGKPTTGASAHNILGDQKTAAGTNTGTSPAKHMKGINPESGEKFASGLQNVDGKKSGVKTLSKVAGGHGAEKKGSGPGPVGAGTGDKAGQTSIDPATKRQFLPQNN
jgi:hypothetical protein